MKNKDAIEGILKGIISRFHSSVPIEETDDTEYIKTVRTVIETADAYVAEHQDEFPESDVLPKALYEFAREKWLVSLQELRISTATEKEPAFTQEDIEYYKYYYDYIYHTGTYPK